MDLQEKVDRIVSSAAVDWRVRERLRIGKSCLMCRSRAGVWCHVTDDYVGEDASGPPFIPFDTMTCGDWTPEGTGDVYLDD